MPIDPEVSAEISAIKNKILKIETDLTSLTGKDLAEAMKQITSLRADLSGLLKTKNDPPPPPDDNDKKKKDPLGEFIESGNV